MLEALKNKLKQEFIDTFQSYAIKIANDIIRKGRDGIDYWLVEIVPKKEGIYLFNHTSQTNGGLGYRNRSFDYFIHVSRKGTKRILNGSSPYYMGYDCWVGDTVVIPISLEQHIINHKFSTNTNYSFNSSELKDPFFNINFEQDWNIIDNDSKFDFLGVTCDVINHADLKTQSIFYNVFLKAKEVGVFTLMLNELSVPVVIIPKIQSVKILPFTVVGRSWENTNASSLSIPYWLETSLVREGDLLKLCFLKFDQTINNKKNILKELKIRIKPKLKLSKKGYDFWLFKK